MAEEVIRARCRHCQRKLRLMNVPAYKLSVKCPDCGSVVPLQEDKPPRSRKPKSTVAVLVEETDEHPIPIRRRTTREEETIGLADVLHHPLFHVLLFVGLVLAGYALVGRLNPRHLARHAKEQFRDTIAQLAAPDPTDFVPIDWQGVTRFAYGSDPEVVNPKIVAMVDRFLGTLASKAEEVYLVTGEPSGDIAIITFAEVVQAEQIFPSHREGEPYRGQSIYREGRSGAALFSGRVAVTADEVPALHAAIDRFLDSKSAYIDFGPKADFTTLYQRPFRDSSKVSTSARVAGLIPIEFDNPQAIEEIRATLRREGTSGDFTIQVRMVDAGRAEALAAAYLEQNQRFRQLLDRAVAASEISQASNAYRIAVANFNTVPTVSGNRLQLRLKYAESIKRLTEKDLAGHVETSTPSNEATVDVAFKHPELAMLTERHGEDKVLQIHLTDVPRYVDRETLRQWFASFDGVPDRESCMMVEEDQVYIAIAPIESVEELLAQVTFGEAKLNEGRNQIEVAITEPSALPRPSRPAPPAKRDLRLAPTDERTLTQVIAALAYGDARSQSDAIDYLRKHEPVAEQQGRVSRLLVKALENPKTWAWEPAPRAFILWMTQDHVPTLLRLTQHPSSWVRSDALERLGDFPDPRVVEVLVAALAKDRGAAEDSLKRIGPVAEPAMRELLGSANREDQLTGCKVLAIVGSKKSVPELEAMALSFDETLATEAKRTLEYIAY